MIQYNTDKFVVLLFCFRVGIELIVESANILTKMLFAEYLFGMYLNGSSSP